MYESEVHKKHLNYLKRYLIYCIFFRICDNSQHLSWIQIQFRNMYIKITKSICGFIISFITRRVLNYTIFQCRELIYFYDLNNLNFRFFFTKSIVIFSKKILIKEKLEVLQFCFWSTSQKFLLPSLKTCMSLRYIRNI